MIEISVVLPQPRGADQQRQFAGQDVEVDPVERGHLCVSLAEDLRDLPASDGEFSRVRHGFTSCFLSVTGMSKRIAPVAGSIPLSA